MFSDLLFTMRRLGRSCDSDIDPHEMLESINCPLHNDQVLMCRIIWVLIGTSWYCVSLDQYSNTVCCDTKHYLSQWKQDILSYCQNGDSFALFIFYVRGLLERLQFSGRFFFIESVSSRVGEIFFGTFWNNLWSVKYQSKSRGLHKGSVNDVLMILCLLLGTTTSQFTHPIVSS